MKYYFIFEIWSPLKVFTDLCCLFLIFMVDLTFCKILNIREESQKVNYV